MMDEKEIIEKIAYNVIQGRVESEDEGIEEGLIGEPGVVDLVEQAVEQGIDARKIVLEGLSTPMEIVGEKYEKGDYLIPDMLASAECVGAAMDILAPHLVGSGVESKGKFIIATVAGDLHDIGKNIVAIMLKGAGYEVLDLGNNVPTEKIVEAVKETGAGYLGLSALLTTTMRVMGDVIEGLKGAGMRDSVKVLIGGAPTSKEFAEQIGADAHCSDAFRAIDVLKQLAA
jgi:5-methyltetrahydrofolate--homocysteine methyltransferase